MEEEKVEEKKEKKEKKKYDSALVTKESMSAVGGVFSLLTLLVLCTRSALFGDAGLKIHMLLTGTFGYAAYPLFVWLAYLSVAGFFGVSLFKNKKAAVSFWFTVTFCMLSVQTAIGLADGSLLGESYLYDCFQAGETFPVLATTGWFGGLAVYGLTQLTSPVGALVIFASLTLIAVYLTAAFAGKMSFRRPAKAKKTDSDEGQPLTRVVETSPEPIKQSADEPERAVAATDAQPMPGYTQGYDPSSMGGYYPYTAQVTQRPGVMLSSDGTSQGAGFSPFAPSKPRETGRSFTYEESREFLFGATPAEIYRKNLIFDSNASVNKRPFADPVQPAFTSGQQTYSASYAQAVDKAAERTERIAYPEPFVADARTETLPEKTEETPLRRFTEETPARGTEFDFGARRGEEYSPYELRVEEDLTSSSRLGERKEEPRSPYGLDDAYTVRDISTPAEQPTKRDAGLSLEQMEGDGRRHDYMGLFSLENPRVFGGAEEGFEEISPRDRSALFDETPVKKEEETDLFTLRGISAKAEPAERTEFLGGSARFDEPIVSAGEKKEEPQEKKEEKPAPKPRVYKPYVRIPLDYFDCTDVEPEANEAEAEHIKRMILGTLSDYKVNEASIASVTFGPTVTRYNVVIPRSVSPKKVVALEQEIAIALCSSGVNIYPSFEDGAVSIEVPNKKRQDVFLGCMLTGEGFTKAKPTSLTFAMGKDVANRKVYGDICKMTHLLVAGASGSGKSAFLASLLISLIVKYSPEEMRLILIDPKKTEFVLYNGLPHLMINEIITDPSKAVQSLNWAIGEMNRRYGLFEKMSLSGTYVVNLDEYNSYVKKEEKLPKIVIVVDELADLMLAAKKEMEDKIQNLTQKARAAGIHLVLATQRPSVDVITGVIKGNLSTRIAFTVTTELDSRVILDQGGAHKLLGRGDMLYTMSGINTPVRVQGAFIPPAEAQKVVNFIKANNEAFYDEAATAFINNRRGGDGGNESFGDAVDESYITALKVAIQMGNASISMLQRKCSIGFNKAGKIIEWMEMMEYISPFEGAAKPRKVLITKEEFERLYGEF